MLYNIWDTPVADRADMGALEDVEQKVEDTLNT